LHPQEAASDQAGAADAKGRLASGLGGAPASKGGSEAGCITSASADYAHASDGCAFSSPCYRSHARPTTATSPSAEALALLGLQRGQRADELNLLWMPAPAVALRAVAPTSRALVACASAGEGSQETAWPCEFVRSLSGQQGPTASRCKWPKSNTRYPARNDAKGRTPDLQRSHREQPESAGDWAFGLTRYRLTQASTRPGPAWRHDVRHVCDHRGPALGESCTSIAWGGRGWIGLSSRSAVAGRPLCERRQQLLRLCDFRHFRRGRKAFERGREDGVGFDGVA
jgi:hypothetical protein